MRIASAGHAAFAATMIGIGMLGLVKGDFAPVWEPAPKDLPAREAVAWLCGFVSLGSGIGLLFERTAAAAARVLLASLLAWFLLIRVPVIFAAPAVEVSWQGCGEPAVIVAGAGVLYAWFAAERDRQRVAVATGDSAVRIARALYGLALIPLGLAHFAYVKETVALVPAWLPSPVAWAYLTGCTYVAAGVGVLIGVYVRQAAALSALQMGTFTLLVWAPIVVAGANAFQRSEAVLSWTLTASAWVVADSCRRARWLATTRN